MLFFDTSYGFHCLVNGMVKRQIKNILFFLINLLVMYFGFFLILFSMDEHPLGWPFDYRLNRIIDWLISMNDITISESTASVIQIILTLIGIILFFYPILYKLYKRIKSK
jgi:TRAP-type C4-dicarboxylate transport system permease small subunit